MITRQRFGLALRLLSAVALSCAPLYAQSGAGSMTGVITDQSGAAIPTATVTVRDEATGFVRTTTGNDTGNYNLPGLRPASYDVVVECQGFRRYSQKAFQVQVSQAARLDIQLEVGEVAQEIEVSGTAQLLHTENATVGAAIGTKEITDLPLNGRNFVQLALLVPGVNTGQPGAGSGGGISIGGARSEQNAFQLDGVSNSDQWDNNIVFRPNIDSIQEFKIEVSNYAAEFGTGAGGQINVVTKSGTNQYHGSLYEFLRNNAAQSNNFFQRDPNFRDKNGRFVAPPFNQNQFGGSLGGPVMHNRTFYWVDYEGLRRVRGQTGLKTVPNAALKAGDFSSNLGNQIGTDALGRAVFANEIFDPRSSRNVTDSRTGRIVSLRDQFPGNRLPVSRFDPIAAKVLQKGLWPDPNTAGARDRVTGNPIQNYADGRNLRDSDNQFSTRIDHQFSDRDTVFGRYNFFDHDGWNPGNFPGMERLSPVRQHVLSTSYTKTLSPTRVNEFRFGYQRVNAQAAGVLFLSGQNMVKEFGVLGLPLAPPGAPDFTVSGFTNISSGGELVRQNDTFQILDQFSFNKGRHFFKIGFEVRRVMQGVVNNPARTRGEFILENPEWTGIEGIPGAGNTFANFLLGLSQRKGRRPGDHASDLRAAEYAAFFQDDFKVSSRLTVNYGVRYQLYIPPKDTKNRISGVRLTNPPASFQQGGVY
jgi:hypothetical protein